MKKILVVEDELILQELLSDTFTDQGFKVLKAADGQTGLKAALKHHPDLILLDILLPKIDGLTMLARLRDDRWGRGVPVIILTNVSNDGKLAQALQLGVYDYLLKSKIKLATLVKQVDELLNL